MTQPEKDKNGFWKYKVLPPEAVLLSIELFKTGMMIKNTPFIIHSMIYDDFQFYRITEHNLTWIEPFILANRMYYMSNDIAADINSKLNITDKTELKLRF